MRTHPTVGLFFAGFLGTLGLVGCASDAVSTDEDPQSTLTEESAYTTGVGAKLGGDYVSSSGLYPTLSLNVKAQSYTWDTGIRCITTPCPSGEAGKWTLYKGLGGRYYAHLLSSAQQSHWFRVGLNKAGTVTGLDGVFGETAHFVPRIKADPCTGVRCAAGTTCQANGNTASCVPNPVTYPTCATTKCASNHYCADRAIVCITTPCAPTVPSCDACPTPGTTINCMPGPGTRPAACAAVGSVLANCPGVTVAF